MKCLVLLFLIYLPQNKNFKTIVGNWHATYCPTDINSGQRCNNPIFVEMKLKPNYTGIMTSHDSAGLNPKGIYRFRYAFINKNVIEFYTSTTKSYHQFTLNNTQLNLTPYPRSKIYNESIAIIDAVDFHK